MLPLVRPDQRPSGQDCEKQAHRPTISLLTNVKLDLICIEYAACEGDIPSRRGL